MIHTALSDPVTPAPGVHPTEIHAHFQRNTHSIFTAAASVPAADQKPPNYTPRGTLVSDATPTRWDTWRVSGESLMPESPGKRLKIPTRASHPTKDNSTRSRGVGPGVSLLKPQTEVTSRTSMVREGGMGQQGCGVEHHPAPQRQTQIPLISNGPSLGWVLTCNMGTVRTQQSPQTGTQQRRAYTCKREKEKL